MKNIEHTAQKWRKRTKCRSPVIKKKRCYQTQCCIGRTSERRIFWGWQVVTSVKRLFHIRAGKKGALVTWIQKKQKYCHDPQRTKVSTTQRWREMCTWGGIWRKRSLVGADLGCGTEHPKLPSAPCGTWLRREEGGKEAVEDVGGGRRGRGVGLFVRAKRPLPGGCYKGQGNPEQNRVIGLPINSWLSLKRNWHLHLHPQLCFFRSVNRYAFSHLLISPRANKLYWEKIIILN